MTQTEPLVSQISELIDNLARSVRRSRGGLLVGTLVWIVTTLLLFSASIVGSTAQAIRPLLAMVSILAFGGAVYSFIGLVRARYQLKRLRGMVADAEVLDSASAEKQQ